MKTVFNVRGPFEVPYNQGKAGRTITDENIKTFWNDNASLFKLRGCYVFGIRAAKGWTPGYLECRLTAARLTRNVWRMAAHVKPLHTPLFSV